MGSPHSCLGGSEWLNGFDTDAFDAAAAAGSLFDCSRWQQALLFKKRVRHIWLWGGFLIFHSCCPGRQEAIFPYTSRGTEINLEWEVIHVAVGGMSVYI